MAPVVDASVAVRRCFVEDGPDLLRNLLDDDEELHAPHLLVSQLANALASTDYGDLTVALTGSTGDA
ncbi:MAG: type II toxin-antitoxin system VapC family toxin [Acidobacteriia bacterium]|nr:type II toxin-antitoxin system VapC family toxin [Terriglobia bacterium]